MYQKLPRTYSFCVVLMPWPANIATDLWVNHAVIQALALRSTSERLRRLPRASFKIATLVASERPSDSADLTGGLQQKDRQGVGCA